MSLSYTSILAGASGQSTGYTIPYSARFVSGNSSELVFNPGSASTSQRKVTYSVWVKRAALGARTGILRGGAQDGLRWDVGDTLSIFVEQAASFGITTTAVFRDTSAWYHIFAVIDTTNATTADRMQLWVNGVRQTVTGTCPTLNYDLLYFNKTGVNQSIGYNSVGVGTYADYYLSNFYGIDGQALTPSSFGQTNTSGVWVPKAYAGTYGTNGFFLAFANSAALGTDTSGNARTFTSSGLTSADQVTDTPTNNYATFNPLAKGSLVNISAGNLTTLGNSGANNGNTYATIAIPTSGKYHIQATIAAVVSGYPRIGVATLLAFGDGGTGLVGSSTYGGASIDATGEKNVAGSSTASWGPTWAANDVIDFYIDADNGAIYPAKNNTVMNSGNPNSGASRTGALYTYTPGTVLYFGVAEYNASSTRWNFGQSAFTYSTYSSYVALSTANLPAPAIKDGSAHFQTTLYTGTAGVQSITQTGNTPFQPDLVWIKARSAATNHVQFDSVRGATKRLYSSLTNAEDTNAGSLTSFNSNGFSLGTTTAESNANAVTHVAWQWKAGGAGSTNTQPANGATISSVYSANPTVGFAIVTWTGTGAAGTIYHGLGVAPKFIIVKERNVVQDWRVYHADLGAGKYVSLNLTNASNASSTMWNNTSPTASVFSVATDTSSNESGKLMLAYCFAEIAGFSKIGSYTGNGAADGPFVYCGFRPAFVLTKRSDSADSWVIKDTARDTYNVAINRLYTEQAAAEDPSSLYGTYDILSNGFKFRDTNGLTNGSGGTYIYAAFAERPFGGTGVSPATAR